MNGSVETELKCATKITLSVTFRVESGPYNDPDE